MTINVVTHNGTFHADEVLSIALLSLVKGAVSVVRTRDEQIINKAKQDANSYVLDVGGEYDPTCLAFDHHQRGFDVLNGFGDKMSTFGLIVEHLKDHFDFHTLKALQSFSGKVDLQDNGVESFPELFWISEMNALDDFDMVLGMATNWLKAKLARWSKYAEDNQAIEKALATESNGIIYSDVAIPVDNRLHAHEHLKLVVCPCSSGGYAVRTLSQGDKHDLSKPNRCPAPYEWRGLTGAELENVAGVKGVVFCHATGFYQLPIR